jgi:hypothetical protein
MIEMAREPLIDTRKSADRNRAKERAGGNAVEAKRAKGRGTVTRIGAPEAEAQRLCRINGAGSAVDGDYRVSEATHSFSRDGGRLTVGDLLTLVESAK